MTVTGFEPTTSLAKWLCVRLQTKWLRVRILLMSLKLQISPLVLSKKFIDIQVTIECRFTLKCVRDMTITNHQPNGSQIITLQCPQALS